MVGELYVGLNVHKLTTVATILDAEGKRVDHTRFSSADSELVSYLKRFSTPQHVVLEACNVWPHVFDAARSTGADVTLAHPYKVRVISEASLKSDRVDSEALAQLLRLGSAPVAYASDPVSTGVTRRLSEQSAIGGPHRHYVPPPRIRHSVRRSSGDERPSTLVVRLRSGR